MPTVVPIRAKPGIFLHHRFAMFFSCEMKRGDSENSGNLWYLWSQNVTNDIVTYLA